MLQDPGVLRFPGGWWDVTLGEQVGPRAGGQVGEQRLFRGLQAKDVGGGVVEDGYRGGGAIKRGRSGGAVKRRGCGRAVNRRRSGGAVEWGGCWGAVEWFIHR